MKILVLILFLILTYSQTFAVTDTLEWEYMGSPGYGYGIDFGINNKGDMFFCGYSSIEKSTDGGETWENILHNYINSDFCLDSKDNMYVSSIFDYILFSSDNGNSWDTIHVPLTGTFYILNIFTDTTNRVYVLVSQEYTLHIFTSDNNGKEWTDITFPVQGELLGGFGGHVNKFGDIAIGIGTDSKQKHIYIKSHTDTTWKELVYELNNAGIIEFISPKEFYIIASDGLYYTDSYGDSLKYIEPKGCFEPRYINTTYFPNDSEIYVGTRNGMAYSSDKGNTWLRLDDKFKDYDSPEEPGITAINLISGDDKGTVYAMPLYGGLFVTTDHGNTWADIGNKLNNSDMFSATFDKEGNLYVSSRGISKSTDHGRTWQFLGFKEYWDGGQMFCTSKGSVLASTIGGVVRTTDQGQTWKKSKKGLANENSPVTCFSRIVENRKGILFGKYRSYNIVARSFDDGETWERYYDSAEGGSDLAINSIDELLILRRTGEVFRSIDDAVSWEQVGSKITDENIYFTNLVMHPNAKIGYAYLEYYRAVTYGNGGAWIKVSGDLPPLIQRAFVDSANKFCFFWEDKIQRSDNKFSKWDTLYNKGLNYPGYKTPIVSPDGYYFLFADYGGIYRSKEKILSVDNYNTSISNQMVISVFPNPISTEAEITYTTHTVGRAKLVLYNLLGLPVVVIADTYMEAGKHSTRISTSDLPSGAYFLRLECVESISAPVWVVR